MAAMAANHKRMTANLKFLSLALLLAVAPTALHAGPQTPDFGPNIIVFDPSMPSAAIQKQIDKVYAIQRTQ